MKRDQQHQRSRITRIVSMLASSHAGPFMFFMVLVLASNGCGGARTEIVPTLPGDGNANTAKPATPRAPTKQVDDPWASRDDLIPAPPPALPRALDLPPIDRFTLANGLPVIVIQDARLPVVSAQLAIKAGQADSPRDKMGLAEFVALMVGKGTRQRSAAQIAEAISYEGGSFDADTTFENTLLSCSTLQKSLATCLTILSDTAMNPTFPAAEIDATRRLLLAAVAERQGSSDRLASEHFLAALWGDEHVRGWPMTTRTVEAIQRTDLVAWHRKWFAPSNAILVVAGDIDRKQIRLQIDRVFRFWSRRNVPAHATQAEPTVPSLTLRLIDKPDQTQADIRVGHLGVSVRDPAYLDFVVINQILGGWASSRLMRAVHADEGKGHAASSYFDRDAARGSFVMATSARSSQILEIILVLQRELARLKSEGPTAMEVSQAITQISGRYASGLESTVSLASAILHAELVGANPAANQSAATYVGELPLRLARVTTASAQQAAAAKLDSQHLVVVIVGNARDIEPQLRKAGLVYEKIGYREPVASWERNPETAASDPKAEGAGRALLDQAILAKGGGDRLARIQRMTITATGKITAGKQELPARLTRRYQTPDKLRLDIELTLGGQVATVTTILNGNKGWHQQPQTGLIELSADAIAELKNQLWRDQELILLRARDKGNRVQSLGDSTRDGRTYDTVRVTRADGIVSITLYLDKKSHLPAFMTYTDETGETIESYNDYRNIDGVFIAHDRKTQSAQGGLLIQIATISFDENMDETMFAKPQ